MNPGHGTSVEALLRTQSNSIDVSYRNSSGANYFNFEVPNEYRRRDGLAMKA